MKRPIMGHFVGADQSSSSYCCLEALRACNLDLSKLPVSNTTTTSTTTTTTTNCCYYYCCYYCCCYYCCCCCCCCYCCYCLPLTTYYLLRRITILTATATTTAATSAALLRTSNPRTPQPLPLPLSLLPLLQVLAQPVKRPHMGVCACSYQRFGQSVSIRRRRHCYAC